MARRIGILGWLGLCALAAALLSGTAAAQEAGEIRYPDGPYEIGRMRPGPSETPRAVLAALVVAPPALLWCALALTRGWREDGVRARRVALRALRRLVVAISRRKGGPTAGDLEHWRELTVRLWTVGLAEPTAPEIGEAVTALGGADPRAWSRLWLEADEALFSSRRKVPADWAARAAATVDSFAPLPRCTWLPARRRHWIPLAALLAMAILGSRPAAAQDAAATGAAAYREGDYEAAAKAWTAAAAQRPGDWALRHNAALAHARAGSWGEAGAQWTAAWRLNAGNAAVREGAWLSLSRLEGLDPALRRLLVGQWRDRLAGRIALPGWQRLEWVGAVLAGLGLAGMVVSIYSRRRRAGLAAGALAVAGGVGLNLVATDAVARHGTLADPLAAFVTAVADVHPIPSDLTTSQQAATLFPGTLVVVDRTFLSWDHVRTNTGGEGWVRTDHIRWLYRGRPADEVQTVLRP